MEWLISQKEFFEVLSYLSNIVVAIAAIFAVIQIYFAKESLRVAVKSFELAKKDVLIRSKREAVVLAAEICERFARFVQGPNREVSDKVQSKQILIKIWKLANTKFDKTSIEDKAVAENWIADVHKDLKLANDVIAVVNELESIAIYFVKGAADEEAAYHSIGIAFCRSVERWAPMFIHLRSDRTQSGAFKNTVELYRLWTDRIKKENLEELKQAAELELSGIPAKRIRPIGEDIDGK